MGKTPLTALPSGLFAGLAKLEVLLVDMVCRCAASHLQVDFHLAAGVAAGRDIRQSRQSAGAVCAALLLIVVAMALNVKLLARFRTMTVCHS